MTIFQISNSHFFCFFLSFSFLKPIFFLNLLKKNYAHIWLKTQHKWTKWEVKASLPVHNPQSQSSEITTVRFLCMLWEMPYTHTHTHTQCLFFIQKRSYVNIYCFASCFFISNNIFGWSFPPEYRNGLPCPSLGDPPDPGTKPRSPDLQADSLPSEPPGKPRIHLMSPLINNI